MSIKTSSRYGGAILLFFLVLLTTTLAQQPPSGLQSLDIGVPGVDFRPGMTIPTTDGYDVTTASRNTWGTNDGFRFVYVQRTGDFDAVVRVEWLTSGGTNSWDPSFMAKAGLMARETLEPGSRHGFLFVNPPEGNNLITTHQRSVPNGPTTGSIGRRGVPCPNAWLRLLRKGSSFLAYWSQDGLAWQLLDTMVLDLPKMAYVGLATTCGNSHLNFTTTALYRNFTITDPAELALESLDIGVPDVDIGPNPGTTTQVANGFDITTNSRDTWDNTDGFRFHLLQATGDFDTVVRVEKLVVGSTNSNGAGFFAKAGLMARETLAPDSRHVYLFCNPAEGNNYTSTHLRNAVHGPTLNGNGKLGVPYPNACLRLTRVGNTFSAYWSAGWDSPWQLLDTFTMDLPQTLYVGLATTSQSREALSFTTTASYREFYLAGNSRSPLAFTLNRANANRLVLRWDNRHRLQSSSAAAGPYTDLPSAYCPFVADASKGAGFFRLRRVTEPFVLADWSSSTRPFVEGFGNWEGNQVFHQVSGSPGYLWIYGSTKGGFSTVFSNSFNLAAYTLSRFEVVAQLGITNLGTRAQLILFDDNPQRAYFYDIDFSRFTGYSFVTATTAPLNSPSAVYNPTRNWDYLGSGPEWSPNLERIKQWNFNADFSTDTIFSLYLNKISIQPPP